jgi:flagellar motor switch protein FliN/FliY
MTEATGAPWLLVPVPDVEATSDGSEAIYIQLILTGGLEGKLLLEFSRADAALVASKLLRRPVEEFGIVQSEALLKLAKAGVGEFRVAAAQEHGALSIDVSLASAAVGRRENSFQSTAVDDELNRISIWTSLSPELEESLTQQAQAKNRASGDGKAIKAVGGNAATDQVNLNLVMDVELNVTLRFGKRQLTLREVLDLTSGSVVELDRQVEEPVELLLDGIVIARGEAVVIDGNYGLRITGVTHAVHPLVRR